MRVQILQWLKDPGAFPLNSSLPRRSECASSTFKRGRRCRNRLRLSTWPHLQAADLVTTTRIGQWRHYKRNEQQIEKLAAFIRQGL